MKTATWVFMGCFDACQFDLTDMPPEWTRFKILTDVNAYDQ
uniref:Uncharacterized protein n=1 Tax=Romanomermis culicivorax TaxID=13658 RepID=A0A915I2Z0_ROMCU